MGCCIAVALVIALVRKAWFALVPGAAPPDSSFAPPARRAADGSVVGRVVPAVRERAASKTAICLGAAAVATAGYAGVVALLRLTGIAQSMPGAPVGWLTRDLVVGGLGTALIVIAAILYRGGRPHGSRGLVLLGAGATYFGLGVLDMHVFSLFDVGGHTMLADALFHGPGLVAMVAGVAALAGEVRRQTAADIAAVTR